MRKIQGWRCLRCDWTQDRAKPEPPFTPKGCECGCWDFECPKCKGAVEMTELTLVDLEAVSRAILKHPNLEIPGLSKLVRDWGKNK